MSHGNMPKVNPFAARLTQKTGNFIRIENEKLDGITSFNLLSPLVTTEVKRHFKHIITSICLIYSRFPNVIICHPYTDSLSEETIE